MPSPSAAFDIFPIVFAIVAVFILVVFVVVIVALVRSSRRLKRVGRDPMTLQADLASQALDSQLLAPAQTTETRLNELAALRQTNAISEAEYAQARADVLGRR